MSHYLSSSKSKAKEWDQAIADAQELLGRLEQRVVRIRVAVQTFTQSRAAGEAYEAGVVAEVNERLATRN
jgi:hypothetical protein